MSPLLPRYTDDTIQHDPFEAEFARREAQEHAARDAIRNGHAPLASPEDGRGIPLIAHGIGGTSPGTDPYLNVQHWPER